ncbi:YfcE family phosphodiesterase [Salipaludibacillus neizhouensis]|uniref:YfcE family phosphodiesterase n=1 Tax=Salipaludibacillus neizhouensis TaxID=885475 RepID=A0A3A9KIM8_9BACI|nr:metallophosphoesterase family protein [Salipaludibacillus neizhouensis]RKL67535.1 YfcE family phosphodiesterase [Salipaludibacillus neizhouensis]
MKLAVISDIHGNEQALKSVLDDVSKVGATHVAVLGDISYRGAKPKECLNLVRELQAKVIKGNADEWIVRGVQQGDVPDKALSLMQTEQAWAREQLSDEDINYLHELPITLEIPLSNQSQLFAFHATPTSIFDVVSNQVPNDDLKPFIDANPRANYYLYGHIHFPYMRSFEGKKILNTGSVGLPFDGDPRASYLLFERAEKDIQVQFRRVGYDIEKACHDLDEAHYPAAARELVKGIYRTALKP